MKTAVSAGCLAATLSMLVGSPRPAAALDVQVVQLAEKTFDQNAFGKLTVIGAEIKCSESLQARIELLQKATELTAAQRRKLELAGQLDIERFFASYESIKRRFKFGSMPRNEWQAAVAKMQAEVKPFKTRYEAGIHGETSLFAKTLANTLDHDQLTSVQTLDQVRANRAYANYIRYTLASIDLKLPLSRKQRETISELLLEHTTPPESYGPLLHPTYHVISRMAQIEDRIRVLFSDQEWAVIEPLIEVAKKAVRE